MDAALADWLATQKAHTENLLAAALPPATAMPERLHAAMRYAVFAGGKRIRPALVAASHAALQGTATASRDHAMAAVELLHTYTLVHDDLPAMDDDDLRRGRPTVHKAWDEATAILVGDALQAAAFGSAARAGEAAVVALARAAGSQGVVGGQQADLEQEGGGVEGARAEDLLDYIHRHKTAALIRVSCELGGLTAGGDATTIARLAEFGETIGLAFQIVDDLLDRHASAQDLGKTPGKDLVARKLTYPAVHGETAARERATALCSHAQDLVQGLPASGHLQSLADFIVGRGN